jgi:hypothetical protein
MAGKMNLTANRKRALVKEERESARRYKRMGFNGLARDEARHARFIERHKVSRRTR